MKLHNCIENYRPDSQVKIQESAWYEDSLICAHDLVCVTWRTQPFTPRWLAIKHTIGHVSLHRLEYKTDKCQNPFSRTYSKIYYSITSSTVFNLSAIAIMFDCNPQFKRTEGSLSFIEYYKASTCFF